MNRLASPYDNLPVDKLAKIQAFVSRHDKELLMAVIPTTGIYSFLLGTFLKTAADFVRENDLQYNDIDQQRLIDFITSTPDRLRQHAAARTAGDANARDVPGAVEGVRQASSNAANKSASIGGRRKKG